MSLKNRVKRESNSRPLIEEAITLKKIAQKQPSPTSYRFSDYDKAEIAIAVANANEETNCNVTPAKLLKALVRMNNMGEIDKVNLIKIIESL